MYARCSVGRNQKEAARNESCNLPVRRREHVTAEVTNLSQRSIRYRRLFISHMPLTSRSLWLSALFVGDTPRQRISIDGPQSQYMARPRHCQQVTCGQLPRGNARRRNTRFAEWFGWSGIVRKYNKSSHEEHGREEEQVQFFGHNLFSQEA